MIWLEQDTWNIYCFQNGLKLPSITKIRDVKDFIDYLKHYVIIVAVYMLQF